MKVVIDTNVFISALFWSNGPPRKIIQSWLLGKFTVVVSKEIIKEYKEVVDRISKNKKGLNVDKLVERLLMQVEFAIPAKINYQICQDADDDKFIATAIANKCKYVVTGDKKLLLVKNFAGTKIVTSRDFIESLSK